MPSVFHAALHALKRAVQPPPFAAAPCRRIGALFLLAPCLAVAAWLCLLRHQPPAFDADGQRAAAAMRQGMDALAAMRQRLNLPVDPALDPAGTGLIGADYTDLTTTLGSLPAKQTSLNPAFAALITVWLKEMGVRPGDRVAVCLTGSFPALNLAALCACEALDLNPVIFSSVGASTYGANIPGFTWLDMEGELNARGLLRSRTRWASLGGIVDTGGGLDETGFALGEAAILRHGATFLPEGGEAAVERDVARRMELYTREGRPKAFINVGGGVTSLGWVSEAALLDNGPVRRVPATSSPLRGVIFRMVEQGVPTLHLLNVERLAARYGLPHAPRSLPGPEDMRPTRTPTLAGAAALLAVWLLAGMCLTRGALRRKPEKAHL